MAGHVITVPGHGEFEFPEGMSDEDMSSHINKYLDSQTGIPLDTLKGYGYTIASAVPKIATNLVGGAVAGATTLGGLESPSAAFSYNQDPNRPRGRYESEGDYLARTTKGLPSPLPEKGTPKSLWERMTTGGGQNISEPLNPGWLTNKATEKLGLHTPQTPGEQIADATTQAIGGAFLGGAPAGASIPVTAGLYGALPGAAGEYARQKTEGIKVPSSVPLIGGKDISPAASAIASMFSPLPVRAGVTPSKINPVKMQQYKTAVRESEGKFTPSAGQLTGDPAQINRELTSKKGQGLNQQLTDAFMETATKPTGSPTTNVTSRTPDNWVNQNLTRIGNNFDNLEQNTHIQHPRGNTPLPTGNTALAFPEFGNIAMARPQDVPGILKIIENTSSRLTPTRGALAGEEIHNALFNSSGTRKLTGEEYRRLATNLNDAAKSATSPEAAHSFRQTANALHNAMSATNPTWGKNWHQARREFANTLVMKEAAAKKPGVTQFTPEQIDTATKSVMGKEPHLRGELENSPFIDAAAAFKPLKYTPLPEEHSMLQRFASRIPFGQAALNKGRYIGAALGGYGALKMGLPAEASISASILGAILGEKVKNPSKLTPYAMNPVAQAWRKNQIAPKPDDPYTRGAVRALFNLPNPQPQNQQQP